jgi:uncharacterized protein YcsI (UPF0317 family)
MSVHTVMSARELRMAARRGVWTGNTAGHCPEAVIANVVILPADVALDFVAFCLRNPRSCPLIEILPAGDPEPRLSCPGGDIRTDLARYRVIRRGGDPQVLRDITELWQPDLVTFVLGCSATFERAMAEAGVSMRFHQGGGHAPTYITQVPSFPAGAFQGTMVVSMRPILAAQLPLVFEISARYPHAHGVPVHVGDPARLGIDLARPDYGRPIEIAPDEVPVYWACGVTGQVAAESAGLALMITHDPGAMLATDLPREAVRTGIW